jgi:hypothetical protein
MVTEQLADSRLSAIQALNEGIGPSMTSALDDFRVVAEVIEGEISLPINENGLWNDIIRSWGCARK